MPRTGAYAFAPNLARWGLLPLAESGQVRTDAQQPHRPLATARGYLTASTLLLGERLDSLVSWLCRLVAFQYAISSHPWRSPCVEGAESRPPDRCGQPRQARDPVSTGAASLVRAAATGAECQQSGGRGTPPGAWP